jgi:hypothetical protein
METALGGQSEFNHCSPFRNCWSPPSPNRRSGQLSGRIRREPGRPEGREGERHDFLRLTLGQGLSEHTSPFEELVQAI